MSHYWVMRTAKDRRSREFLWSEMQKGRLRQGWGWDPELALDRIAGLVGAGGLTDDQRDCWRGSRRMLQSQPDGIQIGDVIIVPKFPEWEEWTIVRVVGPYRFEIPEPIGDFGHILPIELVSTSRPVDPYEEAVSARLRRTMRARQRLWNIDRLGREVDNVVDALESPPHRPDLLERFQNILDDTGDKFRERLGHHFGGAEVEKPCQALLEALYGQDNVVHKGGPTEKGADFICTSSDPLGVEYRVAVQLKHWEGVADLTEPLEQIRQAYENYEDIAAGVIFSFLEKESEESAKALHDLENELHIPIRLILKDEAVRLFLAHLPYIAEVEVDVQERDP